MQEKVLRSVHKIVLSEFPDHLPNHRGRQHDTYMYTLLVDGVAHLEYYQVFIISGRELSYPSSRPVRSWILL